MRSALSIALVATVVGCGSNGSNGTAGKEPDAEEAADAAGAPAADGPRLQGDAAADAAIARDVPMDLAPDAPAPADATPDVADAATGLTDAAADGPGADVAADADTTPVTLTHWRNDNTAFRRATDEAFASYMAAHPAVTITSTTTDWSTYTRALLVDLSRDRLAGDIVLVPPSWTCSFAANLDDVPAGVVTLADAQNTFFAGPLQGSVCGGKLKALPLEYNLEYGGVVVNLDRYQARYPGKQPAWTSWTSFLGEASALARFEAGKPCTNGLDIDPQWPEPVRHVLLAQILQRGGHYWSASDPRLFDFATAEARAALGAMVAWVTQDKVLSPALFPAQNSFVTVRLAHGASGYGCGDDPLQPLSVMGYVGTWGLESTRSLRAAGTDTRFEYFAVPPMVGTEHKFVQNSGFALAVPKTSKNSRAAWDVIKALALSPQAMRKWAATAGTLPALVVNGTPAVAASDPLLAKIQPLLARGQWIGYIPAGASDAVLGAMISNYNAAIQGTKTIEKALEDMQDAANQAILQYQ